MELDTKDNILSFPLNTLPGGAAEFRRSYELAAKSAREQITVEMHDNEDGSLATIGMLINMRKSIDQDVTICLQNCQPKVKYLLTVMDDGEGFVFKEGLLA
ncbi:hypothetical protein [Oceanicoccus sagamiensis]|uniref:STAS domain-containing protein n=1 Tax=Oceanicoccus sagamiensis TaxID=716816 RepID=A0A1X9NED6_9GAMM|nr:hypothetical protein [Oceanicoccus sagamiensis]ARN73909.1 hypothetical protein BST96_07140 [Oceanicoccus sagamiensis]